MAKQNLSKTEQTDIVEKLTGEAMSAISKALETTEKLSEERCRCKLSNSRVSGVARELKELLKVMSAYGY